MWRRYKDTDYEVSENGIVRRIDTKQVVGSKNTRGRYVVRLGKKGPTIARNVMVAQTYLDWYEGCEVHHLNYNREDDSVKNLLVCSFQEHRRYHNKCKFVFRFDKDWNLIESFNSVKEADAATGNCHRLSSHFNNGKLYKDSYWICLDVSPENYIDVAKSDSERKRKIAYLLKNQMLRVALVVGGSGTTSHPNIDFQALTGLQFE